MKIHKPVKHAHRRAIIAQKKAKGKYSRRDLPKSNTHKSKPKTRTPKSRVIIWFDKSCEHLLSYLESCLERVFLNNLYYCNS